MITFNDKIEINEEAAHYYIDRAAENDVNVFDLFEYVLEQYAFTKLSEE